MWGLIPCAGSGTRIQPLAFSKELLPLGSRLEGGSERPRAVSEYLIERMLLAGVKTLCLVIAPGKTDIVQYYGNRIDGVDVCYLVQPEPAGLCDALFQASFLFRSGESWMVGLPDTVWFPADGLATLLDAPLSFLLFPVDQPELFDAVETNPEGRVLQIEVKRANPTTNWIWGAFRLRGEVFVEMHRLWLSRHPRDEYWGTLVNAYLERGGVAFASKTGTQYVDVGTVSGYRAGLDAVAAQQDPGSYDYAQRRIQPGKDRSRNASGWPLVRNQ
jgi:glucose-1-phosphate thymidylyltransferase